LQQLEQSAGGDSSPGASESSSVWLEVPEPEVPAVWEEPGGDWEAAGRTPMVSPATGGTAVQAGQVLQPLSESVKHLQQQQREGRPGGVSAAVALLDPVADTWGQAPAETDQGPPAAAAGGVISTRQQQQEEGAWGSAVPAAVRADTWGSSEPAAGAIQDGWQLQQRCRRSEPAANVPVGYPQDFWGASEAGDNDGWGVAAPHAAAAAAEPATAAGKARHRQQRHYPETDILSNGDKDQQQQQQLWDDFEGGQQRQFDRLAGSSMASAADAGSALDHDGPGRIHPPVSADKAKLLAAFHTLSVQQQQQQDLAAPTATALYTKPTPAAAAIAAAGPQPGSAEWASACNELFSRSDVRWRALLPTGDRVGPFSPAEMVGWLGMGRAVKGVSRADARAVAAAPGALQLCGIAASDYNAQKLPGESVACSLTWFDAVQVLFWWAVPLWLWRTCSKCCLHPQIRNE
jgi:hypothetical protein